MRIRRSIVITLLAVAAVVAGGMVLGARAARRHAWSVSCAGRMFPLTFIALQWAEDSGTNRLPTGLTYLSSNLAVRWMVCPADGSRRSASSWSSFTPEHSSYEIVSPGIGQDDTNSVFLRCRIHGHMAYADMTVFDGARRRHKFE
jgi:hypothetical protein